MSDNLLKASRLVHFNDGLFLAVPFILQLQIYYGWQIYYRGDKFQKWDDSTPFVPKIRVSSAVLRGERSMCVRRGARATTVNVDKA